MVFVIVHLCADNAGAGGFVFKVQCETKLNCLVGRVIRYEERLLFVNTLHFDKTWH